MEFNRLQDFIPVTLQGHKHFFCTTQYGGHWPLCDYLNKNLFKLNKIQNSIFHLHQPHFKCSDSHVASGYYIRQSKQRTLYFHRKFYGIGLLRSIWPWGSCLIMGLSSVLSGKSCAIRPRNGMCRGCFIVKNGDVNKSPQSHFGWLAQWL